jgi:hypothetical protein
LATALAAIATAVDAGLVKRQINQVTANRVRARDDRRRTASSGHLSLSAPFILALVGLFLVTRSCLG